MNRIINDIQNIVKKKNNAFLFQEKKPQWQFTPRPKYTYNQRSELIHHCKGNEDILCVSATSGAMEIIDNKGTNVRHQYSDENNFRYKSQHKSQI